MQPPPIFYSVLCNAVAVATDLTFNAAVVVDVVVIPVVVDVTVVAPSWAAA